MSRRPARLAEANLRRAAKTAQERGDSWVVRILPDGPIELAQKATGAGDTDKEQDTEHEIIL